MSPNLHQTLALSLEVFASSRSTLARRSNALDTLEHMLARLCTSSCETSSVAELDTFKRLQDGFECNIASCLIHGISASLPTLQQIANSVDTEKPVAHDEPSISRIIIPCLSILQGVALIHPPSKSFLCKRWCIQIFVDLLAISRHLSQSSSLGNPSMNCAAMLASNTIDTLLCVLVDAPAAIRVFEEVDGVEAVVKTLKRTGVARGVRIKCLEFLYFYLLDEAREDVSLTSTKHKTPSYHDDGDEIPCSSRSVSPEVTGPRTPRKHPPRLTLLQNDLDFVPMTPQKKAGQRVRLGGGGVKAESGHSSPVGSSAIRMSPVKRSCSYAQDSPAMLHPSGKGPPNYWRSTEEKKEILSGLLGNVDVLVECVSKSGIWGLG